MVELFSFTTCAVFARINHDVPLTTTLGGREGFAFYDGSLNPCAPTTRTNDFILT